MKERRKTFLVEADDQKYHYWAYWNGATGGFYFFPQQDVEAFKALARFKEENRVVSWDTATSREKRILGRLAYKLSKDFLESAQFEDKPFFNQKKGERNR